MKKTKIDNTKLLEQIMRWTDEEHTVLEWCFRSLNLDQINECRCKAREKAAIDIQAEDAATALTNVLTAVFVRTVRWARLQRITAIQS